MGGRICEIKFLKGLRTRAASASASASARPTTLTIIKLWRGITRLQHLKGLVMEMSSA